jgi:1-phosphofructokinase
VTVTIERATTGGDEVHLHPGGQGYWIARLAAEVGAGVTMCCTVAGESGSIVAHLLAREPFDIEAIATNSPNGTYIHDRRGGTRVLLAETPPEPLDRHAVDDLYGSTLAAAAEARFLAVAGPTSWQLVPDGFYERLVADARRAGATVIADVSGPQLPEVLRSGVDVLKISADELRRDGMVDDGDDVLAAARRLRELGAGAVVVTRAGEGSLVVEASTVAAVVAPRLDAVEPAGAGDSMTGALAAVLAAGEPLSTAVRVGAAAATLNVTRHGLGSGRRADIVRFADRVEVRPLEPG